MRDDDGMFLLQVGAVRVGKREGSLGIGQQLFFCSWPLFLDCLFMHTDGGAFFLLHFLLGVIMLGLGITQVSKRGESPFWFGCRVILFNKALVLLGQHLY